MRLPASCRCCAIASSGTLSSSTELTSRCADVPTLARFLVAGIQGSRLVGKANPNRAALDDGLPKLTVGYRVSIEKAREWGLYVSSSRGMTSAGVEEPLLFAEPGLFLVKPDRTLYGATIATMPFARPRFNEIAMAIDFAVSKNYPARGEA